MKRLTHDEFTKARNDPLVKRERQRLLKRAVLHYFGFAGREYVREQLKQWLWVRNFGVTNQSLTKAIVDAVHYDQLLVTMKGRRRILTIPKARVEIKKSWGNRTYEERYIRKGDKDIWIPNHVWEEIENALKVEYQLKSQADAMAERSPDESKKEQINSVDVDNHDPGSKSEPAPSSVKPLPNPPPVAPSTGRLNRAIEEASKADTIVIKIPSLGESVAKATIAKWTKSDGESVRAADIIAELKTDKTTIDLSVSKAGILTLLVAKGATVKVGDLIARIDTAAQPASQTEP